MIGVQDDKLSYQLKAYHKRLFPNNIDYNKSKHCSAIQRSNCIITEYKQEDIKFDDLVNKTDNGQRKGDLNFLYLKTQKIVD